MKCKKPGALGFQVTMFVVTAIEISAMFVEGEQKVWLDGDIPGNCAE
jgi:hypothetical protein